MKRNAISEYDKLVFKLILTKDEERILSNITKADLDKMFKILKQEERKSNERNVTRNISCSH